MRRLSRELISALQLSFEAWPDAAARLTVCIALGWRWNCLTARTPDASPVERSPSRLHANPACERPIAGIATALPHDARWCNIEGNIPRTAKRAFRSSAQFVKVVYGLIDELASQRLSIGTGLCRQASSPLNQAGLKSGEFLFEYWLKSTSSPRGTRRTSKRFGASSRICNRLADHD
jgi:hypothetical protein